MSLVSRALQVSSISSSSIKSTDATGCGFGFVNSRSLQFFNLRYAVQRLHAKGGQPGLRGAIACAISGVGANNGDDNVQSKTATAARINFAPIETYPWDKFTIKLMLHFADSVWFVGRWLVVPALILVASRDVFFTVKAGQELSIPFGLLVGVVLTAIAKGTSANLGLNFQHSVLPWHYLLLGLFFILLRVGAAVTDSSLQAFIGIGGLWQTIRFALDWKAEKEDLSAHHEEGR